MSLRNPVGPVLLAALCPLLAAQADEAKPAKEDLETAWKKVVAPVNRSWPRARTREEYERIKAAYDAAQAKVRKAAQEFLKEHAEALKSGLGLYYKAMAHNTLGKRDEAKGIFRDFIKETKGEAEKGEMGFYRGQAFNSLGEWGDAAQAFADFRKANPKHDKTLEAGINLLQSLRRQGSYESFKTMQKLVPKLEKEMVAANAMRKYGRALGQMKQQMPSAAERWGWNGKEFPHFTVDKVVGSRSFSWDKLKGKVVIVDFWATWCPPCRVVIPHLIELKRKYANQGLEIVGLTRYYGRGWELTGYEKGKMTGRSENRLSKEREVELNKIFHDGLKLNYPFVITTDNAGSKMSVRGIPTLFVLDREGKVRWHKVGSGNEEPLVEKVKELLKEKKK